MLELPLLPELADVLLEHRQRQIALQVPGLERGLLFPAPRSGGYLYSSVLRKPLDRVRDAITAERRAMDRNAGPFVRPSVHGFRHTFVRVRQNRPAGRVLVVKSGVDGRASIGMA